jgi:hypothetical protein
VDNDCSCNDGVYRIECKKGTLGKNSVTDDVAFELTPNEISRIIGGVEALSMLQKMDLITCERSVASKLDVMFPQDSFIPHFRFLGTLFQFPPRI